MKLVKKADGWWITGVPECDDCGPYVSKADAESDRKGLQRTFDHVDDHSFFTIEKLKGKQ